MTFKLQIEGDFNKLHENETTTKFTARWEEVAPKLLDKLRPSVRDQPSKLIIDQLYESSPTAGSDIFMLMRLFI